MLNGLASMRLEATNQPNKPPAKIVAQHAKRDLAPILPSEDACKQMIRHHRSKTHGKEPAKLSDITMIDSPYSFSLSGNRFYLDEVNCGGEHVSFVFATDECIKILDDSEMWFADSTFSTSPSMFQQIFTIHGLWKDRVIPLVTAFTVRKTQAAYEGICCV